MSASHSSSNSVSSQQQSSDGDDKNRSVEHYLVIRCAQENSLLFSRNSVVIKVGMVGDSQIGKTSLMVKYVEGSFDEDYIQTLGKVHPTSSIHQLAVSRFLG